MANWETVEVTTDILICGGGMAGAGVGVEAAYWAKKNGLKVTLVDKAAFQRSGAVAMGLSALNQYVGYGVGDNTVEDYVRYVRQDLMGVSREDLVFNIARHVDSSVHLFEKWGLPIWKDADGRYVHEGRWQLMINGESYKVVVAEATTNAINDAGGEIYERVFIVAPLMSGGRCVGAIGFSTREEKIYVFKAKAVAAVMGGAVHVFKPRSTGEGLGRSWYPPFNSGSSAYFTLVAGAEMTCQEVRFIPVRFKDAYGPVGAWFLLFKSRARSAGGGEYMVEHKDELQNWAPYGLAKPIPANLRNYLGMLDIDAGLGPLYMETDEAIANLAEKFKDDPKALKKKMKELESEAWEDFLDMTISQAILWAGQNIAPEEKHSEIAACEPYFIGSHSGASGAWVSAPNDMLDKVPDHYKWDYNGKYYGHMTTVPGLFAAGDASGASSHKFSDGSHAEGRYIGKQAVRFALNNPDIPDPEGVSEIAARMMKPLDLFAENQGYSSDPEINPNYCKPFQFMFRLQKIMDEYAGGVTSAFKTSKALLDRGLELLAFLKEDSEKLAAEDSYELERCWENVHRMWQAEAHVRTVLFREETRWPGYYFRTDVPKMDEDNWHCFANITWDPASGEWSTIKRDIAELV
ncbi:MAG: adenylyl-sulfate reductase subunit alpha [Deltaproteobacteria bacterium]|nr:adenylyl-sulfate reductase subunit alpha [Deltaproteobacteria bacterium]